jgi:hypothetical protein
VTIAGADYAFTHPSPAALAEAGISFVCRYVSTDGNPKNLASAEVQQLHAAGISIVINFETSATFELGGYAAGLTDAASARAQATALGAPATIPIYYSADFDAAAAQVASVLGFLHGCADAEGTKDLVGVYGGFTVCQAALTAGFAAWQTYAWSGGQWDPRAAIRQTHNGQSIGGVSVDLDEAMVDDFGQWAPAAVPPPVGSAPPWPGRQLRLTQPHMTGADVEAMQKRLIERGWNLGPTGADANLGPITSGKVLGFQRDSSAHGWPLAEDGCCGEHTWTALFERPISH